MRFSLCCQLCRAGILSKMPLCPGWLPLGACLKTMHGLPPKRGPLFHIFPANH